MSREVRMVPPDWQHPKDADGQYIPLLSESFSEALEAWEPEEEEDGYGPPLPEEHMPEFAPGTATHFMMYEDTSEGTPISPAFATAEELARWLADTEASAFADMPATYDQWLATIKRGGSLESAVMTMGQPIVWKSGVAAQADRDDDA